MLRSRRSKAQRLTGATKIARNPATMQANTAYQISCPACKPPAVVRLVSVASHVKRFNQLAGRGVFLESQDVTYRCTECHKEFTVHSKT